MPATHFSDRPAWTIENDVLRITILQCGGHLAEIVLKDGEPINPLWIQSRPTIDSDSYDPSIHGEIYGTGPESRLLSGLAGHNLCFPFWGDPSAAEAAAGMTYHGETNIRLWSCVQEESGEITVGVHLPDSLMKFERRLRCCGNAVYVESEVLNLSSWDRPFGWCEHVSMGPPFVKAGLTRFDAALGDGFVENKAGGVSLIWPEGLNELPKPQRFDLSTFSSTQQKNLVNSFVVKPDREWGFFTAFDPLSSVLLGYAFKRLEFPWLNVWENNDGKSQARGMEFSNTPHHGTMKTLISSREVLGVPAYEWLDARSKITKRFVAFLYPVPHNFQGTEDLLVLDDVIELTERGTGGILKIPIS